MVCKAMVPSKQIPESELPQVAKPMALSSIKIKCQSKEHCDWGKFFSWLVTSGVVSTILAIVEMIMQMKFSTHNIHCLSISFRFVTFTNQEEFCGMVKDKLKDIQCTGSTDKISLNQESLIKVTYQLVSQVFLLLKQNILNLLFFFGENPPSPEGMKSTKLKRHLQTNHAHFVNKRQDFIM